MGHAHGKLFEHDSSIYDLVSITCVCVTPPIFLDVWSMAVMLRQLFELYQIPSSGFDSRGKYSPIGLQQVFHD